MDKYELKCEIVRLCKEAKNSSAGLPGSFGNMSARTGNEILITPSAVPYNTLTPEMICVIDLDGNILEASNPSSEWRVHAAIYKSCPDVKAIFHTHSPNATHNPPSCVPLAKWAPAGTDELAENAASVISGQIGCIMENHGVVAVGADLDEAFRRAQEIEDSADKFEMTELEAMKERHSVRQFLDRPIDLETREVFDKYIDEINSESGLNISVIYDEPQGFNAKLAHYGSFSNVKNYIVLKGKPADGFEEKIGYYGEKAVLKAQMLGMCTCWVALTFNKKSVMKSIPEGEKFSMVIALGYGVSKGTPHKGKSFADVCKTEDVPQWFRDGVEAALLAPTAVNQQKFSAEYKNGKAVLKVSGPGFYTKEDLGIVKYHFELGSNHKL